MYRLANLKEDLQGFTFERVCPLTQEYQAIYASELIKFCEKRKYKKEFLAVEAWKANESIQRKRVDLFHALNMPMDRMFKTMLSIDTPTGIDIADGNHRYVRLAIEGIRMAETYIVEEKVWRKFLVIDHPRGV